MKIKKRQFDKQRGAALILVVVVTVLLAVIGTMFLMTSRVSEMETVAVTDQRDLRAAVQTVVGRIDEVLVKDLFGNDGQIVNADLVNIDTDEASDYPTHNNIDSGPDGIVGTFDDNFLPPGVTWLTGLNDDAWLASLEPEIDLSGNYLWPHITDLWGTLNESPGSLYFQRYTQTDDATFFAGVTTSYIWSDDTIDQVSAFDVQAKVIAPKNAMGVSDLNGSGMTMLFGARADADGDGVADSRWVKVPGLTTSRGKDVFAAVRIIDNCAMLNLNAAHCFYQDPQSTNPNSFFQRSWYLNQADYSAGTPVYTPTGSYLSEINYLPFLRGNDLFSTPATGNWYNILGFRGLYNTATSLPSTPP